MFVVAGSTPEELPGTAENPENFYIRLHRHSNNLRNLSCSGKGLEKIGALLGVRKVLHLEELEFPILLDESEDADTIVLEGGATRGSAEGRPLRYG